MCLALHPPIQRWGSIVKKTRVEMVALCGCFLVMKNKSVTVSVCVARKLPLSVDERGACRVFRVKAAERKQRERKKK